MSVTSLWVCPGCSFASFSKYDVRLHFVRKHELLCLDCGGALTLVDGFYRCESCGEEWFAVRSEDGE